MAGPGPNLEICKTQLSEVNLNETSFKETAQSPKTFKNLKNHCFAETPKP